MNYGIAESSRWSLATETLKKKEREILTLASNGAFHVTLTLAC